MIVLDTNVLSELTKPAMDPAVALWYGHNIEADIYLCDIVLMEQAYGAHKFFQRTGSDRYERKLADTLQRFGGNILSFTRQDAVLSGKLRARRESIGRPISVQDAMIAATCLAHGARLATRNTKDFDGLDLHLINPFEGG